MGISASCLGLRSYVYQWTEGSLEPRGCHVGSHIDRVDLFSIPVLYSTFANPLLLVE